MQNGISGEGTSVSIHGYGGAKIMSGLGVFFFFFSWECGSLITTALRRAHVLYLEQPSAVFLLLHLEKGFSSPLPCLL